MDKLRALQYFVAAAEARSFSGAARRFEVSVPAVQKMVGTLERDLGAHLFERTAKGLSLTAAGETYLDACAPLLDGLAQADAAVAEPAGRLRGMLVVGVPAFVAHSCLVPALPAFHARFPDLQIELRIVDHPADAQAGTCDVLILLGWSEHEHLVRRRLAQTRVLICASPAYWAAHGVPQHPRELVRHQCLLMRNPSTTVVDLWHGEFEGREESVTVSGWLLSAYRDVLLDTVLAGHGVARLTDLTVQPHLRSGRVVPVLTDWALKDAPPVNLFYRAQHRRTPKVRLFIEFVTALFQDIEAKRDAGSDGLPTAERPFWYRHKYGRASAAVRKTS